MDTKELQRLGAERRELRNRLTEVEARIIELAMQALRDGAAAVDIAQWTGYSVAQLRNHARAAGIPPAPRGRRPRAA